MTIAPVEPHPHHPPPESPRRGAGFYLVTVPAGVIFLTARAAYRALLSMKREGASMTKSGFREGVKLGKQTFQVFRYGGKPLASDSAEFCVQNALYLISGTRQSANALITSAHVGKYLADPAFEWTGSVLHETGGGIVSSVRETLKGVNSFATPAQYAGTVSKEKGQRVLQEAGSLTKAGFFQSGKLVANSYRVATQSDNVRRILVEIGGNMGRGVIEVAKFGENTGYVMDRGFLPVAQKGASMSSEAIQITIIATLREGVKGLDQVGKSAWFVEDAARDKGGRTVQELYDLICGMAGETAKCSRQGSELAVELLKLSKDSFMTNLKEVADLLKSGGVEGFKFGKNLKRTGETSQHLVGDPVELWWLENKYRFSEWVRDLKGRD